MGFYKDPKRKDWIYRFQYQGKNYGGRGFPTKKAAMAAREERKKESVTSGKPGGLIVNRSKRSKNH